MSLLFPTEKKEYEKNVYLYVVWSKLSQLSTLKILLNFIFCTSIPVNSCVLVKHEKYIMLLQVAIPMTGSVHFHVPCNDRTAQLQRPSLLRPVSMEEADNSVNEIHESLPRKAAVRLYRQISSGFNSRTIRCVLLISLSVNLTFAVLVGVLVGFWQFSKEQNQRRETVLGTMGMSSGRYMSAKPSDVYSCFPCAESDEISGIRVTVRSKNGFCCTTDIVPGYEQSNGLVS